MDSDFNGDGRDDILWRHENGAFTNWLATANGGFVSNDAAAFATVPLGWTIGGTGDFNGDGRSDIVWLHDNGDLTTWQANPDGGFTQHPFGVMWETWGGWSVAGTGDFNGDGHDDILLRYQDGQLTSWLAASNGVLAADYSGFTGTVPLDWMVAGSGDFNGDGLDDILWRRENGELTNWLGSAAAGFVENYQTMAATVPIEWHVVGTGDFNGDGREDILWRNDNGVLTDWLGAAGGTFVENHLNLSVWVPQGWNVFDIGDFNGDGRDDIFWRHVDGTVTNWLATASGSFVENHAALSVDVPDQWHVQPTSDHAGLWI